MRIADLIEQVASNPKVATASVLGNVSLGTAVKLEVIHGYISTATLAVGFMTGVVICGYWAVRLAREWYALRRESQK